MWSASHSSAVADSPLVDSEDHSVNMGTDGSYNLLPPDVAFLTLECHPLLLSSKQDMQVLANDIKLAWRQDLHAV